MRIKYKIKNKEIAKDIFHKYKDHEESSLPKVGSLVFIDTEEKSFDWCIGDICPGCPVYPDCLTYDEYNFRLEKLKRLLS